MQERKPLTCTGRESKYKNLQLEENMEILKIERNRKRNMYVHTMKERKIKNQIENKEWRVCVREKERERKRERERGSYCIVL